MILLSTFRDTRIRGVVGLIFLLLALYLPRMINPGGSGSAMPDLHEAMPLYNWLFGWLQNYPAWSSLFSLALVMLISLMLVRISFRDQLLYERSMMPALFFVLIAVIIPGSRFMSPILVSSLFFVLAFSIIYRTHNDRANSLMVFNAALLLAIGSLFWLKLIFFLPLFWIVLAFIRPLYIREILYPVLAFGLLMLFLLAWYWGIHNDMDSFRELFRQKLAFESHYKTPHYSAWIAFGVILLCLIMASVYKAGILLRDKTVVQNTYQALFFMFIYAVLVYILVARFAPGALVFIAIPSAFVLSVFFHRKRTHWSLEALLFLMLAAIAFYQVMA